MLANPTPKRGCARARNPLPQVGIVYPADALGSNVKYSAAPASW